MNVSYRARVYYFVNVIDIITFVQESRSPDRLQHSMPPVGAEAGGGSAVHVRVCLTWADPVLPGCHEATGLSRSMACRSFDSVATSQLVRLWWAFATAAILVTLRCPLRLARWVRSGLGSNGPWRFGVYK